MSEWEMVGKPALLLVHMQNAICKAPSPLEVLGHCRAIWEDGVVPKMQGLQKAFRAKGLPVIFVCAHTPVDAKLPVYGPFWMGTKESKTNYMGTRDVEVIDELAPVAGERRPLSLWPTVCTTSSSLRIPPPTATGNCTRWSSSR
jgi:nicotinamidase-related amidase